MLLLEPTTYGVYYLVFKDQAAQPFRCSRISTIFQLPACVNYFFSALNLFFCTCSVASRNRSLPLPKKDVYNTHPKTSQQLYRFFLEPSQGNPGVQKWPPGLP